MVTNLESPISLHARSLSLKEAAVRLASKGFRVFRYKKDYINFAKRPFREGWQDWASNDTAKIERAWTEKPEQQIGISCRLSDTESLLVLDEDGPEAKETIAKFCGHFGVSELPENVVIRSGNLSEENRKHHLWRVPDSLIPDGMTIRNSALTKTSTGKNIFSGDYNGKVDVKFGRGGQIAGPGTQHKTGGFYHFESAEIENVSEIPVAPVWLVNSLLQPKKTRVVKRPKKKGTYLQNEGKSEQHVFETLRLVRTICIECKFKKIPDLNRAKFESYLAKRAKARTFTTRNRDLVAMKAFVNWMLDDDRMERSPFRQIKKLNPAADSRGRERRVFTENEFEKLIQATYKAKRVQCLTGPERALLYTLAVSTGLRRKELSQLLVKFLDIEAGTLEVPAHIQKSPRKVPAYQLPAGLVAKLSEYVLEKKLRARDYLLPMLTSTGKIRDTAEMLRRDCKTAGVDYQGDFGVADFHSIRSQFVTMLCRSCDDLGSIHKLSRHADPNLTFNVYNRVSGEQMREAMRGLTIPEFEKGGGECA